MLLNRRDLFLDLASQLYIASTLGGSDGFTIRDFLRQIILGHELAMRLALGSSWISNDFTPKLLATLIVADQWLQNVKAVKQDKRKEDMKCYFIETSKKAKEQSIDAGAEKWKNAGNTALARKDLNAAVSFFALATVRCPKNAVYLTNRAAAYFRLNKFAEAEKNAKAAVDVDPKHAKAWSWLGAARLELGKYEAGVDVYESAVEWEGDGGTALMKDGLSKTKLKVAEIKDPGWVKLSGK
jgi:tetratricopeptide (TPR) repeat protein